MEVLKLQLPVTIELPCSAMKNIGPATLNGRSRDCNRTEPLNEMGLFEFISIKLRLLKCLNISMRIRIYMKAYQLQHRDF